MTEAARPTIDSAASANQVSTYAFRTSKARAIESARNRAVPASIAWAAARPASGGSARPLQLLKKDECLLPERLGIVTEVVAFKSERGIEVGPGLPGRPDQSGGLGPGDLQREAVLGELLQRFGK